MVFCRKASHNTGKLWGIMTGGDSSKCEASRRMFGLFSISGVDKQRIAESLLVHPHSCMFSEWAASHGQRFA